MGLFTMSKEEIEEEQQAHRDRAERILYLLEKLPRFSVIVRTQGLWQIVGPYGIIEGYDLESTLQIYQHKHGDY